jgi:hypothetical protein
MCTVDGTNACWPTLQNDIFFKTLVSNCQTLGHVSKTVILILFFLILVCEAIDTAATPGLLCQPRVIVRMIVEKKMECRLAGGTEVLGENLPQRHFCPSQNPTWPDPVLNPGRRGGKPASNRLSYGAANINTYSCDCLKLHTVLIIFRKSRN